MASLIPETLNATLQPTQNVLAQIIEAFKQARMDQQALGDLLIDLARMDQLLDRIQAYQRMIQELLEIRMTIARNLERQLGGHGTSVHNLTYLLLNSGSLGSNGVILHAGSDQLLFVSKPPAPPAPKPEEEFTDDCELVEDEDMEDEDHGDNDGGKRLVPVRQWFLDVRTSRKVTYLQTGESSMVCTTFDYRSHQIVKATNGTLPRALYARRNDPIGSRKGGQDYVRITKEMAATFLRALEVNQSLPDAEDVRNALGF